MAQLSRFDMLKLRLAERGSETRVRLAGRCVLVTHPYWHLHSIREIFVDQAYRFESDNPAPRIIDCGANVGLSVLYFRLLYPSASIVAFEADPVLFQLLRRNVCTIGSENIELHEAALSDRDGRAVFRADGGVGGRLVRDSGGHGLVAVRTTRLSPFLDRKVDLLKVDIEGAEYGVLQECKGELGNVKNLVLEFHGTRGESQRLHELLALLSGAGFRYHIREANPSPYPLARRGRQELGPFDLQVLIYGWRSS